MNKTSSFFVIASVLFGLSSCNSAPGDANFSAPDVDAAVLEEIILKGNIYTMNPDQPWANALGVRDGTIVSIGSVDEVRVRMGATATQIDLDDQFIMPSFHDLHVHPIFGGLLFARCLIPQGADVPTLQSYVKDCVEKAEPGEWIVGGQWDSSALGGLPDHEWLDEVAPDNPVILSDTSEHSAWVNAMALELADITSDTPDPEGGIIERRPDGTPTGVFRETAIGLVRSLVPLATDEQLDSALIWSTDMMLSYGITTFTVASVGHSSTVEKEVDTFVRATASGEMKQRVRLCLPWSQASPWSQTAHKVVELIEENAVHESERLRIDCAKAFLDGVPTDSHTAAMLEPYADSVANRESGGDRGILMVDENVLNEGVVIFDEAGITVKFHAAGDAAVRASLNAVEAARDANGFSGILHDVGHNTFVSPDDIPRAKAIQATYEVSPYLWSPSPINDSITAAIGPERIERVWPIKDMVESGAVVSAGSDWAVVPSVNPWIAVESLVTRERPGGSEDSFGKGQAITLEQALKLFTINSAIHLGEGDTLGQLKPGALADLVVLDRNPFEIPETELHQVGVVQTYIEGELVYSAEERQEGETP